MTNKKPAQQPVAFWNTRLADLLAILEQRGVAVPDGATRDELLELASKTSGAWRGGSVVPAGYRAKYGKNQHCGDELADVLAEQTRGANGCDLEALALVQKQNGIDTSRWSHLNPGQQRMNTSNVLRGKLRRGEHVVVGEVHWNK